MSAIDYTKASILRAKGLSFRDIANELQVNLGSLKVGFSRKGLTAKIAEAKHPKAINDLASASNLIRSELSSELHDQVAAVRSKPVKGKIDDIGRRASVVNTITQTASKVYGWDNESDQRMVSVLVLAQYDQPDDPVQSIQESTPQSEPIDVTPCNDNAS